MKDNIIVMRYLMCSYLYYVLDYSAMSDSDYDFYCRHILDNWESISKNNGYVHLLDREMLEAGTGYAIAHKLPEHVQALAKRWMEEKQI